MIKMMVRCEKNFIHYNKNIKIIKDIKFIIPEKNKTFKLENIYLNGIFLFNLSNV